MYNKTFVHCVQMNFSEWNAKEVQLYSVYAAQLDWKFLMNYNPFVGSVPEIVWDQKIDGNLVARLPVNVLPCKNYILYLY